ncbi:MAG: hypothetical protein K6F92_04290 [Lachnospiraceae bacterium]|nr:hypothetical protein [Lachnospiraceae bacterium]
MKKLISYALTFCIILSSIVGTITYDTITAQAVPSGVVFNCSYELTGNPGSDMVVIARAQMGRTMSEFGYVDAWCARFVSDVAALAGESAAIPYNASCTSLINGIINAGGTVVTDWQHLKKGDIVYYCTNGQNHVEIISENSSVGFDGSNYYIHSIGGNCRPNGITSQVYEKDCTYMVVNTIVRPNYSSSLPTVAFDYAEACYDEILVAGWAFDPDNSHATLTAKVYVGGEMGSENAEFAGEIVANSVRNDVSQVYGVDTYHGFQGWVTTTKTGEQPIYIYIYNARGDKVRVMSYTQNLDIKGPVTVAAPVKLSEFKALTVCDYTGVDPSEIASGFEGDEFTIFNYIWLMNIEHSETSEQTYFGVSLNKYYSEIVALRKILEQYE